LKREDAKDDLPDIKTLTVTDRMQINYVDQLNTPSETWGRYNIAWEKFTGGEVTKNVQPILMAVDKVRMKWCVFCDRDDLISSNRKMILKVIFWFEFDLPYNNFSI